LVAVTDEIDGYCSYWTERLHAISELGDRLFSKVLLVASLDCWARAAYPKEGVGQRFRHFVEDFSGWEGMNRVNPWHLLSLLESQSGSEVTSLHQALQQQVGKWEVGEIVDASDDLESAELNEMATEEQLKQIKQATHLSLFYMYRNHLVHELREPGHGVDLPGDRRPYYHAMMGEAGRSWELVYPLGFFQAIARNSLDGLREHFLRVQRSPYESYAFGSPWKKP
jgi:hypothetical protein